MMIIFKELRFYASTILCVRSQLK